MTVNEAIAQFQERLSIEDYREQIPEYYEAMELAIKVFEEIQQYRELGTVEEIADCIKQSEEEFNMLIEYLHIGTIEELKERRETNFDYVSLMDKRYYDGYNKAINKFVEQIKEVYPFTILELEQFEEIAE